SLSKGNLVSLASAAADPEPVGYGVHDDVFHAEWPYVGWSGHMVRPHGPTPRPVHADDARCSP
ncbi:hypothetical protein AK812_SmicGene45856, partial [Symbiodinium microadriaticum]